MPPDHRARGELNGQAVLTEDLVRKIRRVYAADSPEGLGIDRIVALLLAENNVRISRAQVARVVSRKAWAHVQ